MTQLPYVGRAPRSCSYVATPAISATNSSKSLQMVPLLPEHEQALNESFLPWKGFRMYANFLQASLGAMASWHRTWFCIDQGRLWIRPQWRCHAWDQPGCGVCSMGGKRKESLLVSLREYMEAYKPTFSVCAPFGCRDMPMFQKPLHNRGRPPSFALSNVGSPHAADMPFPDYTVWPLHGIRDGWEARAQDIEAANVPWERKLDRAVLAFGYPLHRHWYRE